MRQTERDAMPRRHLACAIGAVLVMTSGAAPAESACSMWTSLIANAGAGVSEPIPPDAEHCGVAQGLDGNALYCQWAFPYRASEAAGKFEAFTQSLQTCFSDTIAISDDLPVNHPDSYDLKQFRLNDRRIAISLKDKGALTKTYVFVRVE